MSRRAQRADLDFTIASPALLGPTPTGEKWEIFGISYATDGTLAVTFYLALATVAGFRFRDQFTVPAGVFGLYKQYDGLVQLDPEGMYVIASSAGTPAVNATVDYVVVNPA